MGQQDIKKPSDSAQIRQFEKSLLNDIRALEFMLANDWIESDTSRIGAEQEMFLVDDHLRPWPQSIKILDELNDAHFTTELGSFNLEFNLDPIKVTATCLSQLQNELSVHLKKVRATCRKHNADVILTGILPTLRKSDLGLENMTPRPRYFALNDAMNRMRGGEYDLFIRGIDELYIKHDTVMLEACNCSFQVHFQVSVNDFARYYNIAQAVAGPVLAAVVNSPMLFGRRLWYETRIAVFQQSTDTRSTPRHIRYNPARVHFGNGWIKDSILEIFREDIARYRVLFTADIEEEPFEQLAKGVAPSLKALQLHNSSVYRWTRPCYGVTDGKPHLRIENRLSPSGPTVIDEVANAAFWLGLITGLAGIFKDITRVLDFDYVKENFYAAARRGLKAQFTWIKRQTFPAKELILQELLPIAHDGLRKAGIRKSDVETYLGIIRDRVSSEQTGSAWMLNSFTEMKKKNAIDKCLLSLTKAAFHREKRGQPVHKWSRATTSGKKQDLAKHYLKVEQFMTTDLFTVSKDDTVELVVNIMHWRRIRHIPVEDNKHRLLGIVNYRSLVRLIQQHGDSEDYMLLPVSEIMQKRIPTVEPETPTLSAISLMRKSGVSCLPVVSEERLVGIITEHDFMNLTAHFLETGVSDSEVAIRGTP